MKRIAILGSTGSVGSNALSVIEAHPDRLEVVGLAAGENVDRFVKQVVRHRPQVIALASAPALDAATEALGTQVTAEVGTGSEGLIAVATHPSVDLVLCASEGTAALGAVLAAIEVGKAIALANKEVLVMAGRLMMEAAERHGTSILPVDSEHSAIHQCVNGRQPDEIKRLILTASGGPFRGRPASELHAVTPAEALRHPTWTMGRKITVDSATLMNKGLEIIEARWLFGITPDRIDVVIHPQSIIHSLVEFCDGSVLAQLGVTDMRLPIQYAFSYPERWETALPRLDLNCCGPLDFDAPDLVRFPSLRLAYRALRGSASLPVILNAANEVAVEAFLAGHLPFTGIPTVIERALDAGETESFVEPTSLAAVREVDAWARQASIEVMAEAKLV